MESSSTTFGGSHHEPCTKILRTSSDASDALRNSVAVWRVPVPPSTVLTMSRARKFRSCDTTSPMLRESPWPGGGYFVGFLPPSTMTRPVKHVLEAGFLDPLEVVFWTPEGGFPDQDIVASGQVGRQPV